MNIDGLSGIEEMLAIASIEQDDDGCNVEEETFDEADYLDDARCGAGYESEWAEY